VVATLEDYGGEGELQPALRRHYQPDRLDKATQDGAQPELDILLVGGIRDDRQQRLALAPRLRQRRRCHCRCLRQPALQFDGAVLLAPQRLV
jgi:hypothetical protein